MPLQNATDNAFHLYVPYADVAVENNALLIGSITGRSLSVTNLGELARDIGPTDTRELALSCDR